MESKPSELEIALRALRYHREAQGRLLETVPGGAASPYGKGVLDGLDTAIDLIRAIDERPSTTDAGRRGSK